MTVTEIPPARADFVETRVYRRPRDGRLIQTRLNTITREYLALSRNALEKRIQLCHRIGCLRYALSRSDEEIMTAFQAACEQIPFLLAQETRPIDGSLALALWGIAAIASDLDVLRSLAIVDPNRIGSQHAVPRYTRMLAALFRALQRLASGDPRYMSDIADYDRESTAKKRIKSRTLAQAFQWSRGLRDMIASAAADAQTVEVALAARVRYLDDSYGPDDLADHEGLLDVHGLGVIAVLRRRGFTAATSAGPLPSDLLRALANADSKRDL